MVQEFLPVPTFRGLSTKVGSYQPCVTLNMCFMLAILLIVSKQNTSLQWFWLFSCSRFSCCACWCLDFLVCCSGLLPCFVLWLSSCIARLLWWISHPCFAHLASPHAKLQAKPVPSIPVRWLFLLTLIRVGEATHPGPTAWSLGICNPAGLNHKAHMMIDDPVDLWLVSETHLSARGFKTFMASLRLHGSKYKWSVPGCHVSPRSTCSDHGQWSGVLALSSHPTRRLTHSWPQQLHETSRLTLSTTFCAGLWLQGAVVYCPPTGPTHPQAKRSANALLSAAVQQLAAMDGPRYLAGDFNHDPDDLVAIQILRDMHFVEVQDLRFALLGIMPQATCKHKTRRDFLYISAELVPFFRGVTVDHDRWIDHATVVASFEGGAEDLVRYPWPQPAPIEWCQYRSSTSDMKFVVPEGRDIHDSYRLLWHTIEKDAQTNATLAHKPLPKKCFGRAARVKPLKVKGTISPVRRGRDGELQPEFHGLSLLHQHHFRQLRRLQSYLRLTKVSATTLSHIEHQSQLWRSIRLAPGFFPHFSDWWDSQFPICGVCVTEQPPGFVVASVLFENFHIHLRQLEDQLRKTHRSATVRLNDTAMSQLYRSVKQDAPVQVDVLFESNSGHVAAIDEEFQALELAAEVDWNDQPLWVNGAPISPIVITPDKIWVESIEGIGIGDAVVQPRRIGKLEHVFQAFTEYWSSMWNAHSNITPSRWTQILDFMTYRVGKVDLQAAPMHVDLLRATARSKKAKAATGLDGVSRHDILALTSNQFQFLRGIYEHAHCTGEWPDQMMSGVVKSLAKKSDPSGVSDYRPITVFSFCYRLWSSLQSRYWLAGLEPLLDRLLCGNRQGYQAASLWRRVLESVECAQSTSEHLAGLVLDLTKAYNLLPRLPCLGLALRFGLDQGTLCAWAGALAQMTRRFWIQGSVSPGVPSNRGFPEGCGLSCLAMLVLNQAWHLWVQESHRLFRPLSYVDNWEILVSDPSLIRQAFDTTVAFTEALDLCLDRQKTFCWAVDAGDRKFLRADGFTVVNSCRDLGAQMVFSNQIRNATLQTRFATMPDLWTKLRRAKGPYRDKLRIVRTASWPKAMHGIASAYVGRKHFHRLRTGMMQGLGLNKPGANAFLQCCLEESLDPQKYAILQTIRDWRTLGDQGHQAVMLQRLNESEKPYAQASLTSILLHRLQVLGWILAPDGSVTDKYGSFDLATLHWTELVLRLECAWIDVVASQVTHRPEFLHFGIVDVLATRHSLDQFDCYDRGVLHNHIIGATITNAHACHWSASGSAECCACGQPDSLFHRFWVCAASADLRRLVPWDILQLVPVLPKVLTCQGWTLTSPYDHAWKQHLLDLPTKVPLAECPSSAPWIDLFTDGSCMFPTAPSYRVSSWAVCYAPPPHVGFEASSVQVLGAEPLGGLVQTAFRSELFALVVSLTWGVAWDRSIRLWTDCQGVIDKFWLLVDGKCKIHPCCSNSDLWTECFRLVGELGRHRICLTKVSAHQSWDSETDETTRWIQISNACVDRAAKSAHYTRKTHHWELWTLHANAVAAHGVVGEALRSHQLLVSKRWTEEYGIGSSDVVPQPAAPRLARRLPFRCAGLTFPDTCPQSICKSWGDRFSEMFRSWWSDVLDPNEGLTGWISFTQLYIDFQISYRHAGLIKEKRGWLDPEDLPGVMPERHPFRRRVKWFRLLVQQWIKQLGADVTTSTTRPRSVVLACHVGCIALPAKQARMDRVEQWLRDHTSRPICGLGIGLDALPPGW